MFDNYYVRVELTHPMLGTNPMNLNVMDTHIIDRQRKLIAENSNINKAINKYYKAKEISKERATMELGALRCKIEEVMGESMSDSEFETLKGGDFKKFSDLKETMSELDEKGITCFFRNQDDVATTELGNRKVCIGSHMILGYMKAASEAIIKATPGTKKKGTVLQSNAYTHGIINEHVAVEPDLINSSKDVVRDPNGKPEYLQRSLRAMTAQGPRISLAKSEVIPKGAKFEFFLKVMTDSPLKEEHIHKIFEYGQLKGLGQWRNARYGAFVVQELTKMPENKKNWDLPESAANVL